MGYQVTTMGVGTEHAAKGAGASPMITSDEATKTSSFC